MIGVIDRGLAQYGIGVEGTAIGEGGIGVYASAPTPGSTALQVRGSAAFSSGGEASPGGG